MIMGTSALVFLVVFVTAMTGSALATVDESGGLPLSALIKEPLRFGAFNIQVFGKTKFQNETIVNYIIRIIKRYDVLLVQEIRDSSETVIHKLQTRLNSDLDKSEQYNLVVSERLGRSNSKEQYAFFYKSRKLEVTDDYVYNDATTGDVFEREPYVVRFKSSVTTLTDFAILGIHIKPSDAINEINNLAKVYEDLLDRYDNTLKDVIFAGDFNADCSYVGKTKWDQVTLRSDDRFVWLIGDDVDTTVAPSDCSYDRILIAGEGMAQAYVPGSASVFYFDSAFGLNHETAEDVSDHYPIEMNLMPELPNCKHSNSDDSVVTAKTEDRIEL